MSRNIRNLKSKKAINEENHLKPPRRDHEPPFTQLSPEPIHHHQEPEQLTEKADSEQNKKKPSLRDKLKKGGNKKLREKFYQRGKLGVKEIQQPKQEVIQQEIQVHRSPTPPHNPNKTSRQPQKPLKRHREREMQKASMRKIKIEKPQLNQSKLKEELSTMSSLKNSVLPIFSCKGSLLDYSQSTQNKITLHLEILGELAEYSKQLIDIYEDISEWEELVFLVYKKYYIERLKVARALRGIGFNPFHLGICQVGTGDLQVFRKSIDGIKLAKEVQAENKRITECLRSFYNLIIEKSGHHINMEERDNFSTAILKDMATQIDLLKDIGNSQSQKRLNRVFRCAFLIAELEGNCLLGYEESLTDNPKAYNQKAEQLFHQCLIL